jgi:hypothetical protein
MLKTTKLATAILLVAGAGNVSADIINFSFTGQLTVLNTYDNSIVHGYDGPQTPIEANLTIDTNDGTGFSDLEFNFSFWDNTVSIYEIDLSFLEDNLIAGQMRADWSGSVGNLVTILWDATGLFNAIDYGLKSGDRISGTNLYRDFDGDGYAETRLTDVNSATPWSDTLFGLNQGPAPIATTAGDFGIVEGDFVGIQIHLDIGSGNSLYVESITTSEVPVPAALWLLGSGLLGLVGFARRRAA